jgi:hypothetical protein
MVQQNNNTSTSISNVQQKTIFYAKDTTQNMENHYCSCMDGGNCPRHCTCSDMFCTPCDTCELFEVYTMSSTSTTGFEEYPRFGKTHDSEHKFTPYLVQIEQTKSLKTICLRCGGDSTIDAESSSTCECGCGNTIGSPKFIRLHVESEEEQEQRFVAEAHLTEQEVQIRCSENMLESHVKMCNCTECN